MQDFFPAAFLNSIPPALRELPQQVRAQTGIAVSVQEIDEAFAQRHPSFANAAAVLDIDHVQQAITIRVAHSALSPRVIAHELIHLKPRSSDDRGGVNTPPVNVAGCGGAAGAGPAALFACPSQIRARLRPARLPRP